MPACAGMDGTNARRVSRRAGGAQRQGGRMKHAVKHAHFIAHRRMPMKRLAACRGRA